MAVLASPLGDHMRAVHASPLAAGVDLSGARPLRGRAILMHASTLSCLSASVPCQPMGPQLLRFGCNESKGHTRVALAGEERRDRLLRARGGFVELASLVAALAQSGSEAAGRASDALPLFDRL